MCNDDLTLKIVCAAVYRKNFEKETFTANFGRNIARILMKRPVRSWDFIARCTGMMNYDLTQTSLVIIFLIMIFGN